ncbi:MAG TPA: DUF1501 domain-containing protein [Gemmataceae bacterium]|nr:DUF1501 domain-containing protein [Gemmataceae bacterium]
MSATRREFLKTSGLVAFGATVPTFLGRTALAAEAGKKDTVLVVVQLTGGNDGLNTVIPFADAEYAKLRPTLKIPKEQVKKLNDSLGLHPAMEGMAKLYEDGAMAVVQGVGYPNPSQSHFRSMDIWQAASMSESASEGWIGKALKQMPNPAFHVATKNEPAPLALAGAPVRVPSITSLADFELKVESVSGSDNRRQKAIIEGAANMPGEPVRARSASDGNVNLLDFVSRTAVNTYASSKRLQEIGKNYQPKEPYPQTGLAERLKLAAQLIDGGLGARLFYVSIDGFDTHAGQGGLVGPHPTLWREVSGAITAFYKDMAARGHKDRVCVMTFSEFGRRAKENGSKGTDHGAAAPMFLVGAQVKAGVVGEHPSLTKLEMGNLKHAVDFRQVYAAVLDRWLVVPSRDVLGGEFKATEIFKS